MQLPGPTGPTGPTGLAGTDGAGVPTVVFEAGMAASRSYWALVQPLVGHWARSVAYDRAGLGCSAPDHRPRTLERMVEDLEDLLDHLAPGPFVLVAHSGGGAIVRAATTGRPERVAGLVLVDVTDEACDLLFEPSFRRMERFAQTASRLLATVGLLRLLYRGQIARFPADVQAELRREGFTTAAIDTRGRELAALVSAMERFREQPPELPDVPVTVISGARSGSGMTTRIRAAANASHRHRAARSPQGRHVVAERSGHMIVLTEPDLIAAEIHRILHRPATTSSDNHRQAPDTA